MAIDESWIDGVARREAPDESPFTIYDSRTFYCSGENDDGITILFSCATSS